jgi:hypothetical protein
VTRVTVVLNLAPLQVNADLSTDVLKRHSPSISMSRWRL